MVLNMDKWCFTKNDRTGLSPMDDVALTLGVWSRMHPVQNSGLASEQRRLSNIVATANDVLLHQDQRLTALTEELATKDAEIRQLHLDIEAADVAAERLREWVKRLHGALNADNLDWATDVVAEMSATLTGKTAS